MNRLDFIIIGAAKSGTTALHEYLRWHPALFLPAAKELPYYTEPELLEKGLQNYLATHFRQAKSDQLLGKTTPQYMHGIEDVMPDMIAHSIHADNPEIRLVAVLRHPIERAYSHYKMSVRRGYETRRFEDAVQQLLNRETHEQSLERQSPTNVYVSAGEYGRILKIYVDLFGIGQMLVLFSDELQEDAAGTVRKLCRFLGVDDSFRPPNLERRYHEGGSAPRFKFLSPRYLNALPLIPQLWKRAPSGLRRRINFSINKWNIRPDTQTVDKRSAAYESLAAHYATDIQLLERLISRSVPWSDLRPARSER